MHEMGIATSVFDVMQKEAEKHPGTRVTKVGMRLGGLAGVDPSSLSFCFEVLVKGTTYEPVVLDIVTGSRDELEVSFVELED